MPQVIKDIEYDGLVRRGCSFKDGRLIRYAEIHTGNLIRLTDLDGAPIAPDIRELMGRNFIIQGVEDETSSFGSPHLILTFFGFSEGGGNSRRIVLNTEYPVAPPQF
jgi:hypothetical protein